MTGLLPSLWLGVVQGLTEFLPVSSDGHLTLLQAVWGAGPNALAMDVALHVGTLGSMVLFFRRDLLALMRSLMDRGPTTAVDRRQVLLILLATVVTGGIGLSLKPLVEERMASFGAAGAGFLLTTAVLLWGEKRGRAPSRGWTVADAPLWHALLLGAVQGAAVWPGLSRSASTISVALVLGWRWEAAGRFSFLAAMPAIAGATLLTARDIAVLPKGPVLVGLFASFLVGTLALGLLMRFLAARRLWPFALYTFALGLWALLKAFGNV